jgi:hypothetical protein
MEQFFPSPSGVCLREVWATFTNPRRSRKPRIVFSMDMQMQTEKLPMQGKKTEQRAKFDFKVFSWRVDFVCLCEPREVSFSGGHLGYRIGRGRKQTEPKVGHSNGKDWRTWLARFRVRLSHDREHHRQMRVQYRYLEIRALTTSCMYVFRARTKLRSVSVRRTTCNITRIRYTLPHIIKSPPPLPCPGELAVVVCA